MGHLRFLGIQLEIKATGGNSTSLTVVNVVYVSLGDKLIPRLAEQEKRLLDV